MIIPLNIKHNISVINSAAIFDEFTLKKDLAIFFPISPATKIYHILKFSLVCRAISIYLRKETCFLLIQNVQDFIIAGFTEN